MGTRLGLGLSAAGRAAPKLLTGRLPLSTRLGPNSQWARPTLSPKVFVPRSGPHSGFNFTILE